MSLLYKDDDVKNLNNLLLEDLHLTYKDINMDEFAKELIKDAKIQLEDSEKKYLEDLEDLINNYDSMANKLKKTCDKEELLDEISAKNILKD
jgi:hypothetical protein